jgi:hypothetical protein
MFTDDNELKEKKILKILEYFLSLHEADEIYNLIFDDNADEGDIIHWLDEYKKESDLPQVW